MKLNIKDRLYIPQLLTKQGTLAEFCTKKNIIAKIAISEDDRTKYNIQEDTESQKITWDVQKDIAEPIEVTFTVDELKLLQAGIESLAGQTFSDDFWMTCEKVYDDKI